jgi:predicted transposase/invertase (TIGR01784 family)
MQNATLRHIYSMKTISEMPLRRFNPLNDFMFYKIMGEKGDEVQLLGFLNAVLGRIGDERFTSVEILENKTFVSEIIGNKTSTFDVRAVLHGGNRTISPRVNVEVQLRNQHNMDKRSLFYWSWEYVKSLKAGEDYRELPDVIAINIVDYNFLPLHHYHTCFHLREDSERDIILTNSLEIHYLNMVQYRKLRGKDILNDPLCRWLAWFNEGSSPDLVMEVTKMDNAIQMASERMAYLFSDEDALRAYEIRAKALSDWTSAYNYATETGYADGLAKGMTDGMVKGMVDGIAEGITEGRAEGRVEGLEEKALEIARNLKKMDLSISQIAEGTGLSPEIIKNL